MSAALWAAQKGLADALVAAGLPCYPSVPEKATPPFRYVLFSELTPGKTFGQWVAHLRVVNVAKRGQNAVMDAAALIMAAKVINAVEETVGGYALDNPAVDEPARMEVNGTPTLGVAVNVTVPVSRAAMREA